MTAALGAEIGGVHLGEALDDDRVWDAVHAALDEHQVIGFRGQHLDDATHVAVAERLGTPQVHVIQMALGRTVPVEQIADSPTTMPDRDGWHFDAPFLAQPPLVGILRSLEVPDAGGDTVFANMYQALERLSPKMRDILRDCVVHYPPHVGLIEHARRHHGDKAAEKVRAIVGDGARHPMVKRHPRTGREVLYFSPGFSAGIVDLTSRESALVWELVEETVRTPNVQCRWRWQAGDVVMWDEIATQHFGAADHVGQSRVMRRVLVGPRAA